MSKYPTEITLDVLEKNSHITTDEIIKDIEDTKIEISNLKKEIRGYRLIAEATISTSESKMVSFKQRGKQIGLDERRDFIRFLQAILEERRK